MDQVIVLKQRPLIEQGSFREWLKAGGAFADIAASCICPLSLPSLSSQEEERRIHPAADSADQPPAG